MLVAGMKMGQKKGAQQAQAQAQQQGAAEATAQASAPAAGGLDDAAIAQIQKLADLHKSGVLSDEEFAAAKKKILG